MSKIEEMNKIMYNYVTPNGVYDSLLSAGKKMSKVATIEGEIMIDRAGDVAGDLFTKLGNVFHTIYEDFVTTTVKGLNEYMDHQKKTDANYYSASLMNKKMPLTSNYEYLQNQMNSNINPMNSLIQQGGTNESEFMKYVYIEKPIWFTKKDMIWN